MEPCSNSNVQRTQQPQRIYSSISHNSEKFLWLFQINEFYLGIQPDASTESRVKIRVKISSGISET